MKKSALALCLAALAACAPQAPAPKPVVSEQDKTLHAVGLVVAKNLEVFQLTPEELDRVIDGVRAGRAGKPAVKVEEFQGKIGQLNERIKELNQRLVLAEGGPKAAAGQGGFFKK